MNYSVRVGDEIFVIKNVQTGTVELNGMPEQVELRHVRGNLYYLRWNAEVFSVQIEAKKNEVRLGPHVFEAQVEDERSAALKKFQSGAQSETGITTIKAPMPGLIVRVEAQKGESVKKGQSLLVIEAMKMENEIKSPLSGLIMETMVESRMTVEKGAPLLQIKPE